MRPKKRKREGERARAREREGEKEIETQRSTAYQTKSDMQHVGIYRIYLSWKQIQIRIVHERYWANE